MVTGQFVPKLDSSSERCVPQHRQFVRKQGHFVPGFIPLCDGFLLNLIYKLRVSDSLKMNPGQKVPGQKVSGHKVSKMCNREQKVPDYKVSIL